MISLFVLRSLEEALQYTAKPSHMTASSGNATAQMTI